MANFNEIVKEILFPRLSELGFKLKYESKGIFEYENGILILTFSYDHRRSFEADVSFLFKVNSEAYTYSELREYFYCKKILFPTPQIIKGEQLRFWILEVEKFLKDYLGVIIRQHIEISHQLNQKREERVYDYNNNRNEKNFKEDIESFWRDKDYKGIVRLVKKYNGNLDDVIKKKYEYSLKKIEKTI